MLIRGKNLEISQAFLALAMLYSQTHINPNLVTGSDSQQPAKLCANGPDSSFVDQFHQYCIL